MRTDETYDGTVTPGGAAQSRSLGCLEMVKVAVDEQMSNNCYLLRCTETGDQALIDAAAEADVLLDLVGDHGLTTIITTHQHWDHHRALKSLVEATGAQVVAGAPDAEAITEQTGVPVDRQLGHGDTVQVGSCHLTVIALAGHTPGSIALVLENEHTAHPHLWTGDSLFPGGVGNTFGDEVAFAQLVDEVETKVFGELPDDTWFYPGHGNDSTLGVERPHVHEWRERGW